MTYPEFTGLIGQKWIEESRKENPLRNGQLAWNELFEVRPDICRLIMAGPKELDPFNDDSRIPAFFKFVEENW